MIFCFISVLSVRVYVARPEVFNIYNNDDDMISEADRKNLMIKFHSLLSFSSTRKILSLFLLARKIEEKSH